ncbi:molybdopterin-dependent oxidoreductase [Candidatus Poriferisocius sp.]|uniref:molybdopterin-dependent oxidoreductase n=1 Tax=Candidatus Poriferisocius sp. TaxID=3101276 RepID=UPI003B598AC5
MSVETHYVTCPLCEAMCGLEVKTQDGKVLPPIRADHDDVWSKGFLCPKGTTLGHLHEDPDRVRVPLVRDGGRLREATWEEAFARCEELLHGVRTTHGPEALTYYIGNPTVHSFSLSRYVGSLVMLSGVKMGYSAGTIDQWPKNVSSACMYGNSWMFPTPDITRTQYLVVMGANPHASQGSLLACPDVLGEMDKIRQRGGKCVVIDPRRTGTCDHADEWVPIVPGTDAAFLLALAHVLFDEGLVDLGTMAELVNGVDDVETLVRDWTPERVAATTRIPAETTRRLAREIAAADSACVYGRIGLCNQEFGTLASWLIDVVNLLTANFDVPGGMMFGNPIAPAMATINFEGPRTPEFGRWHSRVRGAPEVLGQVPVSCLSEEIITPGDGQIKALVTVAGNPVISSPEAGRLDEALPLLDAMISIDNYVNETTRHADVILPGLSPLEQPHYDEMIWSWAARTAGNWSDPVFDRGDRPDEWEVLVRVGGLMGGQTNDEIDVARVDDELFSGLCGFFGLDPTHVLSHYEAGGPERMTDFFIRIGHRGDRYGENPGGLTLQDFKDNPHGLDFGPMIPRAAEVINTPSGKIEMAPPYITADAERLSRRLGRDDGLVLVSRRHVRSNNSWLHNVKVLVKGKDRCTLLVHPDDAAHIGLADGRVARVSTEIASIDVPVEVSDEMMPGVVCLPHGWGHNLDGVQLSVAKEFAGVNNNLLAPGELVDEISGNAIVNGIKVEVVPVPA